MRHCTLKGQTMKIWKKTALFALAALAASAAWSETLETLRARRRIYAPSVSAAFDWASVPAQGAFLKANASFVPEARETQVRVARQGSDLLVRMEMTERKSDVFAGREKFTLWQNDYAEVMLVTPETSDERVREIDRHTGGFIYMVSSASVTGAQKEFDAKKVAYFSHINSMNLRIPRMIGFGISNKQTLDSAQQNAAGAIIGSKFVNLLRETNDPDKALDKLMEALEE